MVVEGRKVTVEIDTTKAESFFYDPTWDTPVVQVQEADYPGKILIKFLFLCFTSVLCMC